MKQNTHIHLVAVESAEQEIQKPAAFWTLGMTGSFAMELDIVRSVWQNIGRSLKRLGGPELVISSSFRPSPAPDQRLEAGDHVEKLLVNPALA
jgi:hypothetical protein